MTKQDIVSELDEWNHTYPNDGNPDMVDRAAKEIQRLREHLSVIRISAWELHSTPTEDNRTLLTRLCEDALQVPIEQRLAHRSDNP